MVFEWCFENNVEEQMVSRIYGDGGHRLWLQRPLNLLTREQRTNYIVVILLHFGIFEYIKYIVSLIGFYYKMICFYNLYIEFG